MSSSWAVTQASIAGSRGAWKHQAAFHRFLHVNEVDQDRDGRAAGRGLVLDLADLVVVPVGQRDPGPGTGRVTAPGLAEQRGDGLGGPAGDIGGVPRAGRFRRLRGRLARLAGQDLLRGPRLVRDGDVEHAPGLGHPLVSLLPGPAPFPEVPGPLGGGLGAAAAQRPGQHRHPLGIRRQRQRPGPLLPGQGSLESGRVRGGLGGDLLQLPLADGHPGRRPHELPGLLIGPGLGEQHRQLLQAPGIPPPRQVQHRISREQRPHPLHPGPVADPPHPHRPQHRHDGAGTPHGPRPRHLVRPGHPRQPHLRGCPGIQRVLQHRHPQLPDPRHDPPLQLLKRHPRRPRPGHPARQLRQHPGQQPQPRRHPLRAGRQLSRRIPFHLRLPFRDPDFAHQDHRNGSLTRAQARDQPHGRHSKRATPDRPGMEGTRAGHHGR